LSQLLPRDKSLWRVKINLAKARVLSTLYIQVVRKLILLFIVYPNILVTRSWINNQALAKTTQMHIQIGIKEFKIASNYDFTRVVKVNTCI
jgi:hypothetical protein